MWRTKFFRNERRTVNIRRTQPTRYIFRAPTPFFPSNKLWKAKTEPKVKIFASTMMHQKILTADNLVVRGMQHDPLYLLCNSKPKDAKHLLVNC
jgi:hypothetical protein